MKKITVQQIEKNRLRNNRQREKRQQRRLKMYLMPPMNFSLIPCDHNVFTIPGYGQIDVDRTVSSLNRLSSIFTIPCVCRCCGKTKEQGKLSLDHYIPQCAGGTNQIINLQILCQSCNSIKGDMIPMRAYEIWNYVVKNKTMKTPTEEEFMKDILPNVKIERPRPLTMAEMRKLPRSTDRVGKTFVQT